MALSNAYRGTAGGGVPAGALAAPKDAAFAKLYETLHSMLTETVWEDGTPRVTTSFLVFCDEGRWKVMVNDRDSRRVAFVSAQTFAEALASVEKALVKGSMDWRLSREGSVKGKKA